MEYFTVQEQRIPALGLGTWKLSGGLCADIVAQAIGLGYRHIDTAQIYENEAAVGQGIQEGIRQAGVPRGEIFLTTKIWLPNVSRAKLGPSLDESLRKLGTDYVDLLLLHWPVETVPLAEQIAALLAAQKAGKARLIGVSNYTVAQMREATETLGAIIATNQVEYHPFLTQRPVLDFARSKGMVVTAYSPLARGKVDGDATIREIARAHGRTPGQVSLRWLVQQGVVAIPKTASPARLRENFAIFDFSLSEAEVRRISALCKESGRMVDPDWAPDWDRAA